MSKRRTIAQRSLSFTGTFEAELLVMLLMRHWGHPHVDDADYRNGLLEAAAEALRAAVGGEQLIEEVPPHDMNLVSALWYAEAITLASNPEGSPSERKLRQEWLDKIRRSLPSCFCGQEYLS